MVILNREDYINEAQRQLNDTKFYSKLDENPIKVIEKQIHKIMTGMEDKGQITRDMVDFMKISNPTAGRFYILPKIHKVSNPGRPIVSSNNTLTENISAFVDHFLKPLPKLLPSFIKDTTHFLQKVNSLRTTSHLPDKIILCTLDVTSLYTNIPHQQAIESC